jgi:hypothetical protein
MPENAALYPQADADRLEVGTDQAIAACGGNARDAVKALIVISEFLEAQVTELQAAVSNGYARGRFELPATAKIGTIEVSHDRNQRAMDGLRAYIIGHDGIQNR